MSSSTDATMIACQVIEMHGRYKWIVSATDNLPESKVTDSGVSFATRDEANDDLKVFEYAYRPHAKTFERPKEEIDALLAAAVRGRANCAGFVFGNVQWQEPDEVGCNWYFSHFSYEIVGCVGGILGEIEALRLMYRIPTEAAFARSNQLH